MKLQLLPIINNDSAPEPINFDTNVNVFIFKNITNCKELLKSIKSAEFPESTLLDASRIISKLHLSTACTKAILNRYQNKMKTKSIYTEILFYLSPGNSIVDSFKQFGVSSKTRDVLVVVVDDEKVDGVKDYIKGEFLEDFQFELMDKAALGKIYRIDDGYELESHALSSIAIKGL